MRLKIGKEKGVSIQEGMIGLFFEDINYAADGGLYAEMIENRSFEFLKAAGDKNDYYAEYDGGYAWSAYPEGGRASLKFVTGSPLCEENPHYLRLRTLQPGEGVANQAYDGLCLRAGMEYHITFFARCVEFDGQFIVKAVKGDFCAAEAAVDAQAGTDATYNRFKQYHVTMTANADINGAQFVLGLSEAGTAELDFISMFPGDAVGGVFRKDLFDKLKELKPGFIRFPGGCIVEGNTLVNRYRYKDSLTAPWKRKNNWNRWAVHDNKPENDFISVYSHYNQTLGLGYYEYFLLCEMIGAKPLPVLNVGFACQYQSMEMAATDSPAFGEFLQDAVDLIEFACGGTDTRWGAVRAALGHSTPFDLTMLGVGNEQWQTDEADFFRRYEIFEKTIHEYAPDMRLIGSAGPDVTSDKYQMAWDFYHKNEDNEQFVYAVDEHYYVKPEWMYENVDFYDSYSRKVKVFSGEYAAHPVNGMNRPDANTLEGALAEAAFLTGVERNADVVVLASYAPLFAKVGYAQWSPDMIWFDAAGSYATPSYYVQQMYARNMGNVTLKTYGKEKEAAKDRLYYNISLVESTEEILVKIVNANDSSRKLEFCLDEQWGSRNAYHAQILTGPCGLYHNSIEEPDRIVPYEQEGILSDGFELPAGAFAVIRIC